MPRTARQDRPAHSDPIMNAWAINNRNALAGYDLKPEIEKMARKVADKITEAGGDLRSLGGFTALIRATLPLQPATNRSQYGVPTNPDWYRWDALGEASQQIRTRACTLLQEARRARPIKGGDEVTILKGYGAATLNVTFGSTLHSPTGTTCRLEAGRTMVYESSAENGNVWFEVPSMGRGKVAGGSAQQMIDQGIIAIR